MPVIRRNSVIRPLRQGILDHCVGFFCWAIYISVKAVSFPSTCRMQTSPPQGRQPKATHSVTFPASKSKSVLSSGLYNCLTTWQPVSQNARYHSQRRHICNRRTGTGNPKLNPPFGKWMYKKHAAFIDPDKWSNPPGRHCDKFRSWLFGKSFRYPVWEAHSMLPELSCPR